jgi:hypothetical protein
MPMAVRDNCPQTCDSGQVERANIYALESRSYETRPDEVFGQAFKEII